MQSCSLIGTNERFVRVLLRQLYSPLNLDMAVRSFIFAGRVFSNLDDVESRETDMSKAKHLYKRATCTTLDH